MVDASRQVLGRFRLVSLSGTGQVCKRAERTMVKVQISPQMPAHNRQSFTMEVGKLQDVLGSNVWYRLNGMDNVHKELERNPSKKSKFSFPDKSVRVARIEYGALSLAAGAGFFSGEPKITAYDPYKLKTWSTLFTNPEITVFRRRAVWLYHIFMVLVFATGLGTRR